MATKLDPSVPLAFQKCARKLVVSTVVPDLLEMTKIGLPFVAAAALTASGTVLSSIEKVG